MLQGCLCSAVLGVASNVDATSSNWKSLVQQRAWKSHQANTDSQGPQPGVDLLLRDV
jgi:hypothetical protein